MTFIADKTWRNALRSVSRNALGNFISAKAQPEKLSAQELKAQKKDLKANFLATRYLDDPDLVASSKAAILSSTGPVPDKFALMAWPNPYEATRGLQLSVEWEELVETHKVACREVVEKHRGHVYSAVRNTSGHRRNRDTVEISLVILDADDVGGYIRLVLWMRQSGLAFIVHESATHQEGKPKFRLLIPLVSPSKVGTEESKARWKGAYQCLRLLLGAIAGLTGHGFDPACEPVSHPFFFGSRTTEQAPPRKVHWSNGLALDLEALLGKLPYVPTSVQRAKTQGRTLADYKTYSASAEPSLLELVFEEMEWLGPVLSNGYGRMVRCPNNDLHSNPIPKGGQLTSATVLVFATTEKNLGALNCKHATCGAGYMAPEDVLELCPSEIVARCLMTHSTTTVAEIVTRRLLERPVRKKIAAQDAHHELLQILRDRIV